MLISNKILPVTTGFLYVCVENKVGESLIMENHNESAALIANVTLRQRLAIILLFCMLVLGIGYYFFRETGAGPVANLPNSQAVVDNISVKPAMPKGYQPEFAVRDPFLAPPEYRQPDNGANKNILSAENTPSTVKAKPHSSSKQPNARLSLDGVVGGGNARVAIIRYGGNSRSYQIGDFIGPYRLTAVDEDSATLWGPDDKLVLIVGR